MIQYICDVCGEIKNDMYEVQILNLTANQSKKQHVCTDCLLKLQTFAEKEKTNSETDTETEELNKEKTPKFYDYTQDYKNLILRDFLSTPFYLQSNKKFLFRSLDNKIINDFAFWMSHKIIAVNPPTAAHDEIIVTLE